MDNYGKLEVVKHAHTYIDKILNSTDLFEKASCNNSCSFCCHSKIFMSLIESEYIKFVIKELNIKPNKKRSKIQNSTNEDKIKWINKACPYLLDENSKGIRLCSIYEFRPIVCRTHNSLEESKYCNKEEFPNRFINEGRLIKTEAVTLALCLLLSDNLELTPINKIY